MREIDLSELKKELTEYGRMAIDEFRERVYIGVLRSVPGLVQASPVDTGQYSSSWDVIKRPDGVLIVNYAPHAAVIEYGARPGFRPPIGPLLAWAKRILQDPQTPEDPNDPADYSKDVQALAFGTQGKIFNQGIEPQHILENAIPEIIENIVREVKR